MNDDDLAQVADAVVEFIERVDSAPTLRAAWASMSWAELVAYEAGTAQRAWTTIAWSVGAFASGLCMGLLAVGAL